MARRKKRGGGIRMMFRLIVSLGVLAAMAFFVLFGYLWWQEKSIVRAEGPADAMIVLGAQVLPDGKPSVQLEWRLTEALARYQAHPMPVVVCGDKGADEPATEASVMAAWLEARGVPAEHILLDEKSVNTRQNIENALQLLPTNAKRILIVTSDYHLPRAMAIARDLDVEPLGSPSPTRQEYWLKNHARETLAWGKYFVNKYVPALTPLLPGE